MVTASTFWKGQRISVAKDTYIAKVNNISDFTSFAALHGLVVTDAHEFLPHFIEFSERALTPDQMTAWSKSLAPFVSYIQPDVILQSASLPPYGIDSKLWNFYNYGQAFNYYLYGAKSAPFFDTTLHYGTPGADIHAQNAWNTTTGSSSVYIAEIDTGVDYSNPDLTPNIDTVYAYNAYTNTSGPSDITDYNNHGTMVAGVMGAIGLNGVVGVNWHVKITPIKWLQDARPDIGVPGYGGDVVTAMKAIDHVIQMKQQGVNVSVINASWGVSTTLPAQALADEIQAAGSAGLLFVTVAGNAATNIDTGTGVWPGLYSTSLGNVITVAATNNQDQLASFSNFGPLHVQIAAPGDTIYSTYSSAAGPSLYGYNSGTSFAAPLVAGTIALEKAIHPSATIWQLRAAVLQSAEFRSSLSTAVSYGRLNAAAAVAAIQSNFSVKGSLDTANATEIKGWAYDPDLGLNPVILNIWDGAPGSGTYLGNPYANTNRSDLIAYVGGTTTQGEDHHGFDFIYPQALSAGTHTLYVYGFDNNNTNAPILFGQKTIVVAASMMMREALTTSQSTTGSNPSAAHSPSLASSSTLASIAPLTILPTEKNMSRSTLLTGYHLLAAPEKSDVPIIHP
jgi:subtilisin family serine protease